MVAEVEDLNCRHASRRLSLACERPRTRTSCAPLKVHLEECLMCTNFETQLRFLHQASEVFRKG
jgi:hypothetical protein